MYSLTCVLHVLVKKLYIHWLVLYLWISSTSTDLCLICGQGVYSLTCRVLVDMFGKSTDLYLNLWARYPLTLHFSDKQVVYLLTWLLLLDKLCMYADILEWILCVISDHKIPPWLFYTCNNDPIALCLVRIHIYSFCIFWLLVDCDL